MPNLSMDLLKPLIQDLVGGSVFSFKESDEKIQNDTPAKHSIRLKLGKRNYLCSVSRVKLEILPIEKRIFNHTLSCFQALYNSLSDAKNQYIRDGVIFSVIDLGVVNYLKNFTQQEGQIWSIQNLLYVLKKLSFERYEGEPATTGFYVYRKKSLLHLKQQIDENQNLKEQNFIFYDLKKPIKLNDNFFYGPLAYRYIDGSNCLYCSDIQMRINSILRLDNSIGFDAIDKLNNLPFQLILDVFRKDNSFQADLNKNSEIEISLSNFRKLIWRKGRWIIFNPHLFRTFIGEDFPRKNLHALYKAVYALSKIRHGALILILDKNNENRYLEIKQGSVAGDHDLSKELINSNKNKHINDLKEDNSLIRMLSSDGLTVIDSMGKLIDANVVIDTSEIPEKKEKFGGGRTIAAYAASQLGKVIKVSEDGPIDFFEKDEKIYRFG